MKKALLYTSILLLSLSSCRQDDMTALPTIPKEVSDINVQNANDDKAIAKYLDEHYLDNLGRIQSTNGVDMKAGNFKKLSELKPTTLPSGVIVIIRDGAQPNPGTVIGTTDKIRIMQKSKSFVAIENNGIQYEGEADFINTIDGSGAPDEDPLYYYAKPEVMAASGKPSSYYEIEGFKEGLQLFRSFNKTDDENYNLQGVIIVPSRAAFGRDEYHPHISTYSLRNRTFVFNFQIYNTRPRK